MTIHISEQAEARVIEEARRQGISVEALIEKLINERLGNGGHLLAGTGAALLEVLQTSPCPEIDLTPNRERLPIRDVVIKRAWLLDPSVLSEDRKWKRQLLSSSDVSFATQVSTPYAQTASEDRIHSRASPSRKISGPGSRDSACVEGGFRTPAYR